MHTYVCDSGTRFQYASDLSGDVLVQAGRDGVTTHNPVAIPGHDLLAFVAAWVRMHKIARLDDASPAEILGLPSL